MINRIAGISTSPATGQGGKRGALSGQDLKQLVAPVEKLIIQNPAAALAAAFAVGVAIAWWIKRK